MNRKYKLFSWIGIAAAIVLFLLVNIFASVLVSRTDIKIDLTRSKGYELSEQTKKYLKTYDKDTVVHYVLASESDTQNTDVKMILEKYAAINSHIRLETVDISKDPLFGRKYVNTNAGEMLESGDIVVESGDKFRVVERESLEGTVTEDGAKELYAERGITSALKFVAMDNVRSVCFTGGHNEDPFTSAREALTAENYEISDVDLRNSDIPENTDMVIMAMPLIDLTDEETAKLDGYMRQGGRIQIYVDSNCPELPELNKYITTLGITVEEAGVVEARDHMEIYKTDAMFVADYDYGDVRYYRFAKPLIQAETSGRYVINTFLSSSAGSTTTKDYKTASGQGARELVMMSVDTDTCGAVLVSGTPMLFNTMTLEEMASRGYGNEDFFVSMANYMTGIKVNASGEVYYESDTTVIPPNIVDSDFVKIPVKKRDTCMVIVVILIPAAFMASGLAVFLKRRNK